MKQLGIGTTTYSLAENWDEVPQFLVPVLVDWVFCKPQNGTAYLEVLRLLLGETKGSWKQWNRRYLGADLPDALRERNALSLQALLQSVKWLWETAITKQPFVYIELEDEYYYLPAEDFDAMPFGELQDTLIYYEAYVKQLEPGEKYINLLMASLCRPLRPMHERQQADWTGDRRIPYNEYHAKQLSTAFEQVPFDKKMSVLLYFAGTTKALFERYQLGSTEEGVEEEYPGQSFEKNIHLLAEKGIFGTYDQTRQKNCHNVLIFLEENKKDMQAELEAYEAQKQAYE